MEGRRFDQVTASLTQGGTRRSVLRAAAAGGLATALAAVGLGQEQAEARRRRHHHHKKKVALTISNNIVNGLGVGELCSIANDCDSGLVCAGKKHKRCQNCGSGCVGDTEHCCLVGVCLLGGAVPLCV
jgi:hypothetical protein